MPLLISRTYSETTPESAEDGDFSDTGFVYQDVEFTFRELVKELSEMSESSRWPSTGSTHDWYSTPFEVTDYGTGTGTERQESIHFSRSNPPRLAKYWSKAARAAGLIK